MAAADTASVAPQHVPSTRVTYPPMTKKSKNAAAAAAEPPAKKSKNAAAAGGGGDAHRGAFQVGEKVGVAKFAGRPGLLWRPATIVAIREKKWPVVYDIKWGTNDRYVTPFASYYA